MLVIVGHINKISIPWIATRTAHRAKLPRVPTFFPFKFKIGGLTLFFGLEVSEIPMPHGHNENNILIQANSTCARNSANKQIPSNTQTKPRGENLRAQTGAAHHRAKPKCTKEDCSSLGETKAHKPGLPQTRWTLSPQTGVAHHRAAPNWAEY